MRVLLHFDGTPSLEARLKPLGVEICPESDAARFAQLLPSIEVLWHVLKPVTAQVIAAAPKLKLIQKIGSGVNTIDVEAAKRRGIAVCNLPGTNSRAVAEMTLLLMLACLRRLVQLNAAVHVGRWLDAWKLQDSFGEIGGRTVGLLGYGAVPRLLAPTLQAMGAKIQHWSRSGGNFAEVIETSDIVSLHLPLTPQTEKLVDPRRMKRGSILVNTARGGLVDEPALLEALKSGHLGAAGLDVFREEPLQSGHPLLALPNVVCAPHLAWLTPETLERSIAAAVQNVERLRQGQPLLNRVA